MLDVEGELVADAGEVLLDFAGAGEGFLHVGQNIFRANALKKVGSGEELRRLIARATHEEHLAGFVQTLREAFKSVDAGGVERGHVAEAENDDVTKLAEVVGGFGKLLRGSEEEGPVDAEDGDVGWDVLVLKDVSLPVAEIVARDRSDRGGFSDAVDVEQRSERHAHADGDGEIGKHGESKRREPDSDVGG